MVNKKIKKLLCELVKNKCEMCPSTDNLEIHRIRRGSNGGTYEHRNCKILCTDCHNLIHSNEFT